MSIFHQNPVGVQRLPPEILLLIFSEFRWDGSEPFIPAGSDCPWFQFIRMRKKLLLVCRTWYKEVAPSLYSLVYLHRIGQLPAVVRTLDEGLLTNRMFSRWVAHIRCEFYVPLMWQDVYRKSIVELITLCPAVRTLVHRPMWDDRITNPLDFALLRIQHLGQPFPGLLELTIGEHVLTTASKLHTNLSCFWQLTKLQLEVDPGPYEPGPLNDVLLPNLRTLICNFFSNAALRNTNIIARHWTLPRLQHLSVNLDCFGERQLQRISLKPLETFCTAHGAHLLSLHLDSRSTYPPFASDLSQVFSFCPELIRIAYCSWSMPLLGLPTRHSTAPSRAISAPEPAHNLVHAALRCVTFLPGTQLDPRIGQHLAELELLQRSAFPSLDTIVLLDPRLRGRTPDDRVVPYAYLKMLHQWAGLLAARGIRFLDCENQSFEIVRGSDVEDVDMGVSDESDEDFTDYYYPSSDSGASEFEESSGDESIIHGGSPKTVPSSQLDVEEALEIYKRTLESSDEDVGSDY